MRIYHASVVVLGREGVPSEKSKRLKSLLSSLTSIRTTPQCFRWFSESLGAVHVADETCSRGGLRMTLESKHMLCCETWSSTPTDDSHYACPYQPYTQLTVSLFSL